MAVRVSLMSTGSGQEDHVIRGYTVIWKQTAGDGRMLVQSSANLSRNLANNSEPACSRGLASVARQRCY